MLACLQLRKRRPRSGSEVGTTSARERAASFRFWTDARRGGVSDDLCEWQISLQNGVPEVSRATDIGSNEVPPFLDAALRARPFGGRQHWSRVPGGWLGAFDRGEWGASVWWFGPDGVSRERLGDLHVTAMLDVAGETWLTTGLDHMIYGRGSVLRAVQAGKHWSLVPLAELDQSAYAAVADDAEGGAAALVATRTELVRVTRGGDGGGEVAKLGDDLWGNMRPQNMARAADGTLWIGANHAVIRLVPRATRYESSWLASPDCAAAWPRTCGSRP